MSAQNIEEKILELIESALRKEGILSTKVNLEFPFDLQFGDLSTNVAMINAKQQGKNPIDLANTLVSHMLSAKPKEISTISAAAPGFVNFSLDRNYVTTVLVSNATDKSMWGANQLYKGKKVLVEHSSPNLFKTFHIGHVMNNTIGETLVRLARNSGAIVHRMSYPSDISLGIAKAVWAFLENDGVEKLQALETDEEKIAFLGDCYVQGNREYDDNDAIKPLIREITQKLYSNTNGPELDAYNYCKEINLNYFKRMTTALGSEFDSYIFESEAGEVGKKIVQQHIESVFTESEGAVIYEGEKDGLHTRVFINKDGNPTYEAKDIGLLSLKFDRTNPDLSLFVTDREQTEYFKVVLCAAKNINPIWCDKSVHRTHGRMSFKGQKMSSRLGGVQSAESLLNFLRDEIKEKSQRLSDSNTDELDTIVVGALKIPILKAVAGKNINFDPESSLSLEGDGGPYLQYSAVRARSILAKIPVNSPTNVAPPNDWKITDLERMIIRFPKIVFRATEDWSSHHIVTYLFELAQLFNSWYATTKIIDTEKPEYTYKALIAEAFANTIERGLHLLGISMPSKM